MMTDHHHKSLNWPRPVPAKYGVDPTIERNTRRQHATYRHCDGAAARRAPDGDRCERCMPPRTVRTVTKFPERLCRRTRIVKRGTLVEKGFFIIGTKLIHVLGIGTHVPGTWNSTTFPVTMTVRYAVRPVRPVPVALCHGGSSEGTWVCDRPAGWPWPIRSARNGRGRCRCREAASNSGGFTRALGRWRPTAGAVAAPAPGTSSSGPGTCALG